MSSMIGRQSWVAGRGDGVRRKVQLGEGETEWVACASASAFRGLDAVTGEVLDTGVLAGRVGWLTALVESMCTSVTRAHWNRPDLAQLASGRDLSGVRLPSNAWMALRMLGWAATVPEGLYVPDRVRRVAEEQAGRALRSAWWRTELTDAVLATWPAGPDPMRRTESEWESLREALPDGQAVAASVLLARTRQSAAFQAAHGRLPADLCELEAAPGGGHQVVLAAADKQLATLARCDQDPARYAVLTVRLPVRPDPRTRADWHSVVIRFRLPPTIDVTAALHAPTLRQSAAAQDRTKAGPTRNRPVPRKRRRVPAPPGANAPGGKRPAGRMPQSPARRIQRRDRGQAPHTMSTPTRHQPRGARLGAGFHLHTHATPVTRHGRPGPQPRSRFHRDRAENPAPPRKPKLI
ncbi:hypothetical protein [Streptomyces dysideae]|uniref:hypothetical protein n=1 Tax=Streptomyces dysideae TaxID=909626 RepID=UPI00099E43E3|nr:hypothetical protein [Streptomyces dysideae]